MPIHADSDPQHCLVGNSKRCSELLLIDRDSFARFMTLDYINESASPRLLIIPMAPFIIFRYLANVPYSLGCRRHWRIRNQKVCHILFGRYWSCSLLLYWQTRFLLYNQFQLLIELWVKLALMGLSRNWFMKKPEVENLLDYPFHVCLRKISVPDPWHFETDPDPWIRTLDYGFWSGSGSESGSGFCSFGQWPRRCQLKIRFFS